MIRKLVFLLSLSTSIVLASLGSLAQADALQTIRDSGTISIGYRHSSAPFSSAGQAGKPVGYSIDLCLRIVDELRVELSRPDLKPRWIAVDPQTRLAKIADGTIQLECGSTTNTLTRQREVDFSYAIYLTGTQLLVRKGEDINRFKDLDGKVLAVSRGTTTEKAITLAMSRTGVDVQLDFVTDHGEGFARVEAQAADAYATDGILLYGLIDAASKSDRYEVVGRLMSYEPYALVVPKDDSTFRRIVNSTLARLFRSGEIEHIHAKWFDPLAAPMPDLLRAAFIVNGVPE